MERESLRSAATRARLGRRSIAACARRIVVAAVGVALAGGCRELREPSGPRLGDRIAATPARLAASARIGGTAAATQVLVGAFYLAQPVAVEEIDLTDLFEDGGVLGAQVVPLAAARSQQVPVSIDLAPCLADGRVERIAGGCPVYVIAILLRGSNAFDPDEPEWILDVDENALDLAVVGPFGVAPGATLNVPQALTLDEAQEITVSPATLSLVVGQAGTLAGSVVNAFGEPVPGRTVAWSVADPRIARVEANGVVTGLAAGTTTVRAAAGDAEAFVPVTVAAPRLLLPADTNVAFTVARGAAPSGSASVPLASSAAGFPIEIGSVQVAYGAGASGWLSVQATSARTPASLALAPVNTTAFAPGQYTAAVTVTPTNPSIARRTVLATLTVTGIAAVDCSRSLVAPNFPPATAQRVAPNANWFSGTTGQFFLAYNLGTAAQPITVQWDMYGVPDAITVCFRGSPVYDSRVPISGPGQFVFNYPGSPGLDPRDPAQSVYLYLSIRAEAVSTAWQARVLGNYIAPSFPVPTAFRLQSPDEIARAMAAESRGRATP
ncbi:MAG: Ig-like domain-containing protein [Gemmatirosa sp.]